MRSMATGRRLLIAGLMILGATGGFVGTLALRSASGATPATTPRESAATTGAATQPSEASEVLLDWLGVAPERRGEIRARDAAFGEDLRRLREDLAERRAELAAALEDPASPDALIRSRSESALAASAALERRVCDHLLAIRQHLTADQQKRLFGLCAQGLRQGFGRGPGWMRGGGGGGAGPGPGPGPGPGRGPGGGQGRGMGWGRADR